MCILFFVLINRLALNLFRNINVYIQNNFYVVVRNFININLCNYRQLEVSFKIYIFLFSWYEDKFACYWKSYNILYSSKSKKFRITGDLERMLQSPRRLWRSPAVSPGSARGNLEMPFPELRSILCPLPQVRFSFSVAV